MGASPHANGGRLLRAARPARLRRLRRRRSSARRRRGRVDATRSASCCATSTRREPDADFRLFCPDETNRNRLGAVFEVEDRCLMDAAARATTTSAPTAG